MEIDQTLRDRIEARFRTEVIGHVKVADIYKEYLAGVIEARVVSRNFAWLIAAWQFKPLDRSPHELQEFYESDPKLFDDAATKLAKIALPKPPPAPKPKKKTGGRPDTRAERSDWDKLANKVGRERDASEREVISWVFKNGRSDPRRLDADEVPSLGAVMLMEFIQESASNYRDFLQIWAKLLPQKAAIEAEARFSDDGRKQFDLLDDFMASRMAKRREVEAEVDDAESL